MCLKPKLPDLTQPDRFMSAAAPMERDEEQEAPRMEMVENEVSTPSAKNSKKKKGYGVFAVRNPGLQIK